MLPVTVRVGALAALLAACGAAPAFAGNWAPSCQGASRQADLSCTASEAVVAKSTGQILLVVAVTVSGHGKDPVLTLRLPKDIYIPEGVTVAIDDKEAMKLPVETCTEAGCAATGGIARATLLAMQRGKEISVAFDSAARKPIKFTLPLDDFATSWAAIE